MKKADQLDKSLINMFNELPPEVAQRVREKYEQERLEFVQVVKDMTPAKGPDFWAKASCTHCHGRGIIGERVSYPPKPLLCKCVEKQYKKWLVDVRKYYNALKK